MMRLTAILAALLLLAGCSEDLFDRQAGDRITPDQHYNSLIDGSISLSGAIVTLQDAMPNLIILDGLRTDMMEPTPFADLHMRDIHQQVFTPDNPYTDVSDLYKVIVNANEVITNIPVLVANEREMDEHITKYYTGGLVAMRSWAYFTIARMYGSAVWIDDNLTELPEDPTLFLSDNRMSKEVLIDTLINQLLPYVYDPTETDKVEIRIGGYVNTKGLLGELYLEKGDYVKAVEYLKLACESYLNETSLYKVDRTYQDEGWQNIFLNAESQFNETISVIPFNSRESQNNPLARWMGYSFDYAVRPTQIVVDSFMNQVPSSGGPGDLYRGRGITFGVDTISKTSETEFVTEAYITKYAIDQNDPFSSDIVISRAADLHLLLAEAYNRIGDEESQEYALMFLNQGVNGINPKPAPYTRWRNNLGIRGRVSLEPLEIPDGVTGEDKTLMIEEMIIAERALELAFEGKRWFDLVRVAERRGTPEFLADKVAAKFQGTGQYEAIRTRLMNPENWYLPDN